MKTFAAITTMNKEYYDNIGKYMIESFVKYWPKNVNLYCFVNKSFSVKFFLSNLITAFFADN